MATFNTFLACIRLQGPNSFHLCEETENWMTKIFANLLNKSMSTAELWIREILAKELDPDYWHTDQDPALFVSDLQDTNKINFFKFFCLLLFWSTFPSFFKDKKSLRSHKTVEIKVFLTIIVWSWKDPPDPRGPKTFGSYRIRIQNAG